jgi:hypothetical protein
MIVPVLFSRRRWAQFVLGGDEVVLMVEFYLEYRFRTTEGMSL